MTMILEETVCTRSCNLKEACVLIVDDNAPTASLIEKIVQRMPVSKTRIATSVKNALAIMFQERIDFIISDYKMDLIDGLSFLRLLRSGASSDPQTKMKLQPYRNVPFLILTGYATKDVIDSALDCGAFAVMSKPVMPAVLLERMKSIFYVHCSTNCFHMTR
ncbi:response regulator [Azospirillum doebereinerae]|uniref:Response regulator n=1 Tax=Azospirillum doebereinerae TaxID=92933 RepID=A0A433JBX0_9PROT|nr:response regulator [Azospirillum doebereinerae]MCG5242560.1 response regulator [Azospirillum doebereinerae]RUQ74057.1 response regulator [Azospirillum doebereinerae]